MHLLGDGSDSHPEHRCLWWQRSSLLWPGCQHSDRPRRLGVLWWRLRKQVCCITLAENRKSVWACRRTAVRIWMKATQDGKGVGMSRLGSSRMKHGWGAREGDLGELTEWRTAGCYVGVLLGFKKELVGFLGIWSCGSKEGLASSGERHLLEEEKTLMAGTEEPEQP